MIIAVVDAGAQASTFERLSEAAPEIRLERRETMAELTERLPHLSAVRDVVLFGPEPNASDPVTATDGRGLESPVAAGARGA